MKIRDIINLIDSIMVFVAIFFIVAIIILHSTTKMEITNFHVVLVIFSAMIYLGRKIEKK